MSPTSARQARRPCRPQRPRHEDGLEEQPCETLGVGVEPERIDAVDPLGNVAREDRHEEDRDNDTDQHTMPTERDQCRTESQFNDARHEYDDVSVEREPARDLRLELQSLAREMSNTCERQDATE